MIINPGGDIVAEGSETNEQVIVADVDFSMVAAVRNRSPFLPIDVLIARQ